MKDKDTLFHINWGDGDTTFVIAPDEQTAKERMGDGKGMVNYVVRLDALYLKIFKAGEQESDRKWRQILRDSMTMAKLAGRREVVKWIEKHSEMERCDPAVMSYFNDYRWVDDADWLAQLKEWGL